MAEKRSLLYQGARFRVEWFYGSNGRSQARDYFLALSDERKAKFLALVKRFADIGEIRDVTKFRFEGEKIFAFKPQPDRYLCFFFCGSKVIITNAFQKKGQKLPEKEKEKARHAMLDYEQRVSTGIYYEALKES